MEDSVQESHTDPQWNAERLRVVLDSVGLGLFEYGFERGELVLDDLTREILGLPPASEPRLDALILLVHADDREAARFALAAALESKTDGRFSLECRLAAKGENGESWIALRGRVAFESGKPSRLIGTVADVTLARKGERDGALLAAIVESSNDAIVSKTLEGRVTSWNKAAERLFGYRAEEMIGAPIERVIPKSLWAEETDILKRIRAGLLVERYEAERITRLGETITVSLRVSPIRDRSGRIIGASKIARDIGDQRRAAEAIARSELELRTLTESVPALVYVSNSVGETIYTNHAYQEFVGRPPEELLGWRWEEFVHPDDRPAVMAHSRDTLTRGEAQRIEFRLRRADGAYRWIALRSLPMRDASGAVLRWLGACMDIHETKDAEARLRESDRQKDDFLAVLAHELRNPLAPLRNALEILKLSQDRPRKVGAMREMMERQVAQLIRLIDDLLDVSRVTRGKLELRRRPTDLKAVLESALETARPTISAARHNVRLLLPEEPVTLDADPIRLAQVFSNLLTNSAKFMDAGGEIRVVATHAAGEICISVTDFGIGLAPEELPNLFTMFGQARRVHAGAKGGLGLGLALVKQLVELHGGSVTAESAGRGEGSRFSVRLPLAEGATAGAFQVAAPPVSQQTDTSPGKRRVLVVDDNADSVTSLSKLLELHGHEVRSARDGVEAVSEAKAFRPDVIFMDIAMPRLNGLEATRAIRAEPWGGDIFICALTGFGLPQDLERSEAAGINHHFVKPVNVEAVVNLLAAKSVEHRPA